jgi:hypothetical protein
MTDYFFVKNLYNYEKVIPPPPNLPKNLKTVYITDTEENKLKALELGWIIVKKTDIFNGIDNKFDRRKSVAFINSYPLKVVPEIIDARFIFICDSNINRLWNQYENFVNSCSEDFVLFVTSGYYSGDRDTIISECNHSCKTSRWSYNHFEIKNCTNKYIEDLNEKNVDANKLSVVSAKYIGWNVNHPDYKYLSDFLYKEYSENLQGNIILTYMSGIFNEKIYNFHTKDYTGATLNNHNYSG